MRRTLSSPKLDGVPYIVKSMATREKKRNPVAPFTTSTVQQESSRKLRFSVSALWGWRSGCMKASAGQRGLVGLITYMRTDSTRVSDDALKDVREFIAGDRFGPEYLPPAPNIYKSKKDAQDAHEAIRPTTSRTLRKWWRST